MWWPSAGFVVGGGPSVNKFPYQRLAERGVVSVAVNNVAAYVPVRAFTFSDGQEKFHHALYLDPAMMCFVPAAKLKKRVRAKLPDGSFRTVDMQLSDCPNVWGIWRSGRFCPESFVTDWFAHWGYAGRQHQSEPHRSLMLPCPDCPGDGVCQACKGAGCDKCKKDKRKQPRGILFW
jgi:hypothetical protein